jgi:hypothetical protein
MTGTTVNLTYNKDFLSLLNELSSINESIIIKKSESGDAIVVQRANNAKSVAYRLIANKNLFDFSGDSIAFYKFPEFYQLNSCFNSTNIEQTEDRLILSNDEESLMKGPSKINFENPDASFELKASDLKQLKKMIGLLTTKNMKILCNSSTSEHITMNLYNNNHDNSFSKNYITSLMLNDTNIEYSISTDIITLIPDSDYTVDIKKEGIVRFLMKRENISLEIFTAQID